nr:hypothetical protein [uncultured Draconibacterium sp.]
MKNNFLIAVKSGRKYRIVTQKEWNNWPEKTRNKFIVVDQGSRPYLMKKQSMLTKYLGSNGRGLDKTA